METIEELARLCLKVTSGLNARPACDDFSEETRGLMKQSNDYFRLAEPAKTQAALNLITTALNYPPLSLDFTCASTATRPFLANREELLKIKALALELFHNNLPERL